EWRSKSESPRWRAVWMWANAGGSFGASLVWGVGLSALLYGVPINSSHDFTGDLADLFNGYTVLGGISVVLLFAYHGATYLTLRTVGDLCERASHTARWLSVAAALVVSGFLGWTVAVAVDRNDQSTAQALVPALLGIAAVAASALVVYLRRSDWAF